MENRLLPAKSDVVFKMIFADARNADILADFLVAVLDLPLEEYEVVAVTDPNLRRDAPDGKQGILDVRLQTKGGTVVNIEIQLSPVRGMEGRILFYSGSMTTCQIGAGDDYTGIQRVVCILIVDYNMFGQDDVYHHRFRLYDKDTGVEFTDLLEVDVLELPKLPVSDDGSPLWGWLKFLKTDESEVLDMLAGKSGPLGKAVGILKELSADERMRLVAEAQEKARRDERGRILYAREEGLEQGREEGLEKGLAQGLEKGHEEGRTEQRLETARLMLAGDVPIADIAKFTRLSEDEVLRLRR